MFFVVPFDEGKGIVVMVNTPFGLMPSLGNNINVMEQVADEIKHVARQLREHHSHEFDGILAEAEKITNKW